MNYRRIPFAPHITNEMSDGFSGVNMSKKIRLPVKEGASLGAKGFVGWLENTHPKLFAYMAAAEPDFIAGQQNLRSSGSRISGLGLIDPSTNIAGQEVSPASSISGGADKGGSVLDQFVSTLSKAAAAFLPLKQQQDVMKVQLARMKAGLAPLDVGAYVDPNAGLNVGVTAGTQKTLLLLGGGLAVAFLVSRLIGKR
jgi:hypothetical protein